MNLLILCIKIFFVRILDVSMGTLRTIITIKGKNFYASLVGFVEVLIWFVIVKEALNTDETSLFIAISYSLGFSVGTFIGGILSNKLININLNVQIITNKNYTEILRNEGFGVTLINAEGKESNKYILFIEINSKRLIELKKLIKKVDDNAFIIINESKYIENGFIHNIKR